MEYVEIKDRFGKIIKEPVLEHTPPNWGDVVTGHGGRSTLDEPTEEEKTHDVEVDKGIGREAAKASKRREKYHKKRGIEITSGSHLDDPGVVIGGFEDTSPGSLGHFFNNMSGRNI